jgi:hypothetical protein
MPTEIQVFDNFLLFPDLLRRHALEGTFHSVETPGGTFHGIQEMSNQAICHRLGLRANLQFFRLSPLGQQEPNHIHNDKMHGEVTAILYLNPEPPAGDGTDFWRLDDSIRGDWPVAGTFDHWHRVEAKYNRLVVFPSDFYHSRSLPENYGTSKEDSRLIYVSFLSSK